jgi:hypothetical protein
MMMNKKKEKGPKCPECGANALRPRCLFELGGDCPRHAVAAEWKKKKRLSAEDFNIPAIVHNTEKYVRNHLILSRQFKER